MSSSHRILPPPPPPPLPDRNGTFIADSSFSGILTPKPRPSPPHGSTDNASSNNNSSVSSNSNSNSIINSNANQKRSPGSTRSRIAGTRVPPPPPPRRVPPPPPPRRTATTIATGSTQQKRRRPIHPPPPPPPRAMSLDSSEELASKAREMLNKCLNRSIPTGNLYSGGLGAYYLLLEQSRYYLLLQQQQQQQQLKNHNNNNRHHIPSAAPIKCKKLLKQALEGAQSATGRFKRNNSSSISNQRSNISLLGGEWIGSHALLAVCYRRLEDFAKKQQQQQNGNNSRSSGDNAPSIFSPTVSRNGVTSPARTSLFSERAALERTASSSGASMGGASMVSNVTIATTNPRPRSQRVVDKILHRLEKQHRASDEDDDDLTYYTLNSNYTSTTLSSLVVATVWNQDVLGGRAGALQAIWWLRKEFGDASLGQELVVSLAVKILVEGLSTAASMELNNHEGKAEGNLDDDSVSCYSYNESDILFWVCDSQGSHKAYLGASRGVVGILHTLLGLSNRDWKLVEEQTPNARGCVQNTINAFLSETNAPPAAMKEKAAFSCDENEGISTAPTQQQEEESTESRPLHERFLYNSNDSNDTTENLRPRLDASRESNTTVDWFHGATGLAMLLLEASKVFRSKKYLQEAHRLCDAVIFPRGLAEQREKSTLGGSSFRTRRIVDAPNKKGPVGLAGMAICFLQLSRLCSDEKYFNEEQSQVRGQEQRLSPKTTSLQNVWKTRAALYAKHAHQEWTNYMKVIPTATGTGNAYSLYEGMGGLISLLWQLSLSTLEGEDSKSAESDDQIGFQMPLYGLGFVGYIDDNAISEENDLEPLMLSHGDVTISETPLEIRRAVSPQKSRRSTVAAAGVAPSKHALAESRRRRAAAEAEARKRFERAEEARRSREEQVRAEHAIRNAKRKAEVDARRKAQLLARRKALEVSRQTEKEETKNRATKEAEEKCKREALLLARKQAKERVDARRKEKEQEELAKARAEALRKANETENKRKSAEEEKKKRRALAEARMRRQKKEAGIAKQREEERKTKEEADRLRRAEELQKKEKQRKQQRLAELRIRQHRAAQIANEKEKETDRERREKELNERKINDAERRQRLESLKERRRKEEESKEKRRLQLREERLKKQKELQEVRLRKDLQQALDKEVEKQHREEELRLKTAEDLKIQESINVIHKLKGSVPPEAPPSSLNVVYSPSFLEKKKSLNPAHFSVQTRSSLFWSLQSDSNIGSSENYRPALVAADSTPSSSAMSTTLEETS